MDNNLGNSHYPIHAREFHRLTYSRHTQLHDS